MATKSHKWHVEFYENDGPEGDLEYWRCPECGACGGPVWDISKPDYLAFLDDGSGLELSQDCDESKRIIRKHDNWWNKLIKLIKDLFYWGD